MTDNEEIWNHLTNKWRVHEIFPPIHAHLRTVETCWYEECLHQHFLVDEESVEHYPPRGNSFHTGKLFPPDKICLQKGEMTSLYPERLKPSDY